LAARQVVVAGGDLRGGQVDAGCGGLDAVDDAGELDDGGVGVVAHVGEGATVVALHLHGQVPLRECAQHAGHLLDAAADGRQQAIELPRYLQQEAALVLQPDAAGEIAVRRSHDDVADLLLGLHFDGAVVPFHHVADAPPLGVGHRVDDLAHDMPADRDLRAMGAVEPAEQVALVRRVLVEDVDVAADQRLGVEVGQVAAHVLFGLAQHLHQRPVDVDDVQVGVGDHHAGGDIVQRGADAQVLGGTGAVLPGTGLELDDHLADRGVHLPDLVARAVVHPHVEVAVRDCLDRTERTGQRAQDGAGDQPARQQRRQQYQHAGQDQHPAEAPGARGDVVGVFAAADDPAPALVQADVGYLLHRALDPGLGPGVVEEATAIALRKPDHLHEDLLAVGTGGVAEVLAVQRGLVRMHQHRGVLVVHPQVVAAVGAAQRLDGRQCLARAAVYRRGA